MLTFVVLLILLTLLFGRELVLTLGVLCLLGIGMFFLFSVAGLAALLFSVAA